MRSFPVTIRGEWLPGEGRIWKGIASAPEPFVAFLQVHEPTRTFWGKSAPSTNDTLPVTLRIQPLSYQLPHVQLIVYVGSALCERAHTNLPAMDFRPAVTEVTLASAGAPFDFVNLPFDPPIRIEVLFFAKSDVVVRRNRRWGLRTQHLAGFAPALLAPLTKGTHGAFDNGRAGKQVAVPAQP